MHAKQIKQLLLRALLSYVFILKVNTPASPAPGLTGPLHTIACWLSDTYKTNFLTELSCKFIGVKSLVITLKNLTSVDNVSL